MDAQRWNEIIAHAAGAAVDECAEDAPLEAVALRAATLAAEAIAEAMAEEQRLAEAG